jgi:hypothetical protein
MPNYEINPILHNQGGRSSPYEKYHLTKSEWEKATREANSVLDGLAPANVMQFMNYVDPPVESSSPGELGMRSIDGSYFYLCIGTNKWRRISF